MLAIFWTIPRFSLRRKLRAVLFTAKTFCIALLLALAGCGYNEESVPPAISDARQEGYLGPVSEVRVESYYIHANDSIMAEVSDTLPFDGSPENWEPDDPRYEKFAGEGKTSRFDRQGRKIKETSWFRDKTKTSTFDYNHHANGLVDITETFIEDSDWEFSGSKKERLSRKYYPEPLVAIIESDQAIIRWRFDASGVRVAETYWEKRSLLPNKRLSKNTMVEVEHDTYGREKRSKRVYENGERFYSNTEFYHYDQYGNPARKFVTVKSADTAGEKPTTSFWEMHLYHYQYFDEGKK